MVETLRLGERLYPQENELTMLSLLLINLCLLFLAYISVNGIRYWAERQRVLAFAQCAEFAYSPDTSGGGLAIVCFSVLGLISIYFYIIGYRCPCGLISVLLVASP